MSKKIAILRTGALGDVLLLRPCLWQLRRILPELEIVLLATGERGVIAASALEGCQVVNLDCQQASWLYSSASKLPDEFAKVFSGCQSALILHEEDEQCRNSLRQLGVANIVFHSAKPQERDEHICRHLWRGLGKILNLPGREVMDFSKVPVLDFSLEFPTEILRQLQLDKNSYFVIHPGSGSQSKNMSLDFYKRLGEDFLAKATVRYVNSKEPASFRLAEGVFLYWSATFGADIKLAIAAGEADGNLGAILQEKIKGSVLLPDLNLKQLSAVLSCSLGYAGNDSGVSHLAAQCGIPTNVFFKNTSPEIWAPVGKVVNCL